MAANDILITVNDFVNKASVNYQVDKISNDMTISEIIERIKSIKNYSHPSSSLVLYFARVECKHDAKLSFYNKSNRKMIKLELYLANEIRIYVKTLQSCGSGNSRCIPLWAFCCKQTIMITIQDTCEVRTLKQRIYDITDESVSIPVENIVLLYKGAPLNNFLTLKESELVDGCRVDFFVPLCYVHRRKKDDGGESESEDNKNANDDDAEVNNLEKRSSTLKPSSTLKKYDTVRSKKSTS